jgi:hypothetical protein
MANDFIERLVQSALRSEAALSMDERARMRELLAEYAALRPERPSGRSRTPRSFPRFLQPAFAFGTIVLVAALGGSGITFAAEDALPGDLLYPIKIGVVERTLTALTPAGEAQARWQMRLAERRLSEAAALAKAGRLESSAESDLAVRFALAADKAAASVEAGDPTEASIASASFATRLASYGTVLAKVASTTGMQESSALRIALDTQVSDWGGGPETAALAATATASTTAPAADTERLAAEADRAWKHASRTAEAHGATLAATSSERVSRRLDEASELIAHGRERLKDHDAPGAEEAFRKAIQLTARLEVLVEASAALGIADLIGGETEEDARATTTGSGASSSPPLLPL